MSNPKVFEFAKEIGFETLTLMDKIREWQLPVKNHMAELTPEMIDDIRNRLNPGKANAEAKKVVAKKKAPAKPKKAEAPEVEKAQAASAASKVVRRKAAPAEEKVEKVDEPKAVEMEVEAQAPVVEAAPTKPVKKVAPPVQDVEDTEVPEVEEKKAAPVVKEETKPVVEAEEKKVAAPTPPQLPVVSPVRKKEVVVGQSGLQSPTPQDSGRRNIIGRMDLNRVQAPPNAQGGRPQTGGYTPGGRPQQGGYTPGGGRPQTGGYTPGGRPQQGGYTPGGSSRPPGQQGGFGGPRPQGQGFGGPRPQGGAPGFGRTNNLRTGFVASAEPLPEEESSRRSRFEDKTKRVKKEPEPAGGAAALTEGEEFVFNSSEFKKREMVFQPKKKKGLLGREGMKTQITKAAAHKRQLKINGKMKLSDAAQEMGVKAAQLMKVLMANGVMANMNTDLDFDTLSLIVPEFGWEALNVFKTADEVIEDTAFGDLSADEIIRPPVVAVMGHVDHGKTSLLDAIRKTDVAAGEAGGITQHIGAYQVKLEGGEVITFLDTPGHEAFTAMRARGANVTDIAIIVVAADDGVMPQTAEAINHAKAAGVPLIVAVNKMDKPGANPDRIKQQLTEFEVVPEEWGGTTIFCEVSALKKTGVKELLEQVLLVAEVQELKANPKRSGTGAVIESRLEKGKGPVATLLVQDGTIRVGDLIVAGTKGGRVRSLTNDKGERIDAAVPGMPVEVQGLDEVPSAGDKWDVVKDEKTQEKVLELRQEAKGAGGTPKLTLEEIFSKAKLGEKKILNVILKSDVAGSAEAINGMFKKMETEEVKIKVVHSAVGGITENDVLLATTAKAVIVGFNTRPDGGAQNMAKRSGVEIRTYSIVYEMVDDLKRLMSGLLEPEIKEAVHGRAEVRSTFNVPKIGTIGGCAVLDGKIARNHLVRLIRDGVVIYSGKIGSLKRFKDDAREVSAGFECGIGIENYNDLKVNDIIESYTREEVRRELTEISPS